MELALIFAGIFSSSFLIALSGALMPGPLLTYTVAEAARRGFWAGPLIMLGHGLLEMGLVILLLLGIGAIINQPVIMGVVALSGAGILWWLGYDLMSSARTSRLDLTGGPARALHPFWAGIIMSLANPYWLIWWVTLGLGYVLFAYKYGLWGVVIFLYRSFYGGSGLVQPGIHGRGPGEKIYLGPGLSRLHDCLRPLSHGFWLLLWLSGC